MNMMNNSNKSVFILSMTILLLLSVKVTSQKNKKKPNLLIIQTDEHNFRTLGCYRNTLPDERAFMWGKGNVVETPNIDWLADNGALCTSFYASTPVCSPSRGSFVSGQYPQRTPVVTNDIAMSDRVITFAEVLSKKGYATGYSGKWHLDGFGKPQWEPVRNFGFQDNRYMFNRGHWKQLKDSPEGPKVAARNKKGGPSYGITGANKTNFTTDFLAQKTINFIKKNKNKPFCYMVSIPDPHGPDVVRAPYDTMYEYMKFETPSTYKKLKNNLPSWGNTKRQKMSQKAMTRYFGMVKCIDDNIGGIIKELKATGQLKNTIIVFTSDHGDLLGEHGRNNKGVPYEGSAKIPFIVYYPSKIKEKTIINQALTTVDFMPTILGLMEVKGSGKEDGRNAARLFTNKSGKWNDIAFIRGTGQKDQKTDLNWFGAITDRYKLIYDPVAEPWLMDLEKDPDELQNFYNDASYSSIVKKLTKKLKHYGEKYKDSRIHNPKMKSEIRKAFYKNTEVQ